MISKFSKLTISTFSACAFALALIAAPAESAAQDENFVRSGGSSSRTSTPTATGVKADNAGFGQRGGWAGGRGPGGPGMGGAGMSRSEALYMAYLGKRDNYEWQLYRWELAKANAAYRAEQKRLKAEMVQKRKLEKARRKEMARQARLERRRAGSTQRPSRASWLFGKHFTHEDGVKEKDKDEEKESTRTAKQESARREGKQKEKPSILRAFKRALFGA